MTALLDFRADKDEFFRDDQQSPLLPEQRAGFVGLAYYPERPDLRFEVTPDVEEHPETVSMQTSTGDRASYLRWGSIEFAVPAAEAGASTTAILTVFRDRASGSYFLPFADANAGGETYGAGRYLDVHALDDGRLLVDFNYAYNPYCAYNSRWSCPIPPAENRLTIAIEAGERSFVEPATPDQATT